MRPSREPRTYSHRIELQLREWARPSLQGSRCAKRENLRKRVFITTFSFLTEKEWAKKPPSWRKLKQKKTGNWEDDMKLLPHSKMMIVQTQSDSWIEPADCHNLIRDQNRPEHALPLNWIWKQLTQTQTHWKSLNYWTSMQQSWYGTSAPHSSYNRVMIRVGRALSRNNTNLTKCIIRLGNLWKQSSRDSKNELLKTWC